MKKVFLLTAVLAASVATSCNKSEVAEPGKGTGMLSVDVSLAQDTKALSEDELYSTAIVNIYKEDFSFERECVIIGMFEEETLLGVGVMSNKQECYKVEYLCVDSRLQKGGVGGALLSCLEEIARERGGEKMWMDARVSAEGFYKEHGYQSVGETCLLDYAPVEHVVMEKLLK